MTLNPKLLTLHNQLQNDFEFAAAKTMYIKDKTGAMVPFIFNRAQRHIHLKLEEQLKKTGRVRALVLKGRQQGCSTYIGGRYYHKASKQQGKSVFILSHEGKTTGKLFDIVKRYYHYSPEPLQPELGAANKNQLKFSKLESEYSVGTAGNEDVGRGGTVQYFHGSEVGFWANTDELTTGVLQSVADVPDTEIVLESTANGMSNMFYQKCVQALEGEGDYILIFVPWFWQEEYERDIPEDFVPTAEELHYIELYFSEYKYEKSLRKIYWRRMKTIDLRGEWKFKQEYPAHPNEAFQTSGTPLISPEKIMTARKSSITHSDAPLIMGVDPALEGDRTIIAFRRGREILPYLKYDSMKPMMLAGIIANLIEKRGAAKVFIDVAIGYGTIDKLHELGYKDVVTGVHFSEGALQPDIFLNKRAEIIVALRDWIQEGGVSIPDNDEIQADFQAVPQLLTTSRNLIQLASKKDIKKVYGKSTDILDACALTFAYPVSSGIIKHRRFVKSSAFQKVHSPLKTLSNVRGIRKNKPRLGRLR